MFSDCNHTAGEGLEIIKGNKILLVTILAVCKYEYYTSTNLRIKNPWFPRLLSCRRGFAFAPVGGVDEVLESRSNRGFAQLLGVKHIVIVWQYLAVKSGYPKIGFLNRSAIVWGYVFRFFFLFCPFSLLFAAVRSWKVPF